MARRGLRKNNAARKSLRTRSTSRPVLPAVSGTVSVGPTVDGRDPPAARGSTIPPDAPIPRELRPRTSEPERLSDAFFASQPAPQAYGAHDMWEDDPVPAEMPRHSRRAMLASAAIFGVFVSLILGYAAYHQWVMPEPVDLTAAGAITTPMPAPLPTALQEPAANVAATPVSPQPSAAPVLPSPVSTPAAAAAPSVHLPVPAAVAPHVTAAPSYAELISAGETLARGGQHADALSAYQHALDLRPDGAQALSHMASLYLNRADNVLAKQYAARAVISDPTSSEGWIVLGALQDAAGDRAAAQALYRKCAALGVGAYVRECQQLVH